MHRRAALHTPSPSARTYTVGGWSFSIIPGGRVCIEAAAKRVKELVPNNVALASILLVLAQCWDDSEWELVNLPCSQDDLLEQDDATLAPVLTELFQLIDGGIPLALRRVADYRQIFDVFVRAASGYLPEGDGGPKVQSPPGATLETSSVSTSLSAADHADRTGGE